jgi:hypothetical protein
MVESSVKGICGGSMRFDRRREEVAGNGPVLAAAASLGLAMFCLTLASSVGFD